MYCQWYIKYKLCKVSFQVQNITQTLTIEDVKCLEQAGIYLAEGSIGNTIKSDNLKGCLSSGSLQFRTGYTPPHLSQPVTLPSYLFLTMMQLLLLCLSMVFSLESSLPRPPPLCLKRLGSRDIHRLWQ